MSISDRFFAYAAAFENARVSDDWSVVEPFFTENAVYDVPLEPPLGGHFVGRKNVLAYFKDVLDRLDRRFESRESVLLDGPRVENGSVWIRGRVIYRATGVPDAVLEVEETAYFEGDRIRRLEDHYEPAMKDEIAAYLAAHGAKLGFTMTGEGPRAGATCLEEE